ncbi:HAD family hydrolase [Parafrankia sp. BMG5.11]|uniref:HAD-IIIC family phosphatase n=1 Tax=Parafrankia sp. BMG5.11 TaxID=222540 RepID=UPI00103CC960|nr:HAD-IIIC family phosphatase [Parafrankia sp. BMG5.11]TCJ31757.1 HAD-IIIC family phosphatase [Parafrankia sp. BMG5.11]
MTAPVALMRDDDVRDALDRASALADTGDATGALRLAFRAIDADATLATWLAAAGVARRCLPAADLPRSARVAVLGSYTTTQFAALLPVAAARAGVAVEVYEAGYDQYQREILDPGSGLYRFHPDIVVLAVHHGTVSLPARPADPAAADAAVDAEVERFRGLWDALATRCEARVVQHTVAIPADVALGHVAARLPTSRLAMLRRFNAALGRAAGSTVAVVDCERLAALVGAESWFDARYWHRAKQAVSLGCVPLLARHTGAVIAGLLGRGRKCLVLDLDNTLWGGVLGEDGLTGIALGAGPVGEAFTAFQEYVLELQERGVVLAVCSKNNRADVLEAFARHPDMRLRTEDIAVLSAGWDDKPTQIRDIAETLHLGLDALVFVDDNPAERAIVRRMLPEVDVVELPEDPHGYVRALASYPYFETAAITAVDRSRTAQYQALARAAELRGDAGDLDAFLRDLDMTATVVPLDELTIPRVTQLINKTNQFNVTGRRRGEPEVRTLAADPDILTICVRLTDRFGDHGLVGVLAARVSGPVVDIDTWLLSCRVIGRSLENEMLGLLVEAARQRGARTLRGTYHPSPKNGLVADLYPRLGFERTGDDEAPSTTWRLALDQAKPPPGFIRLAPTP